MIEAQTDMNMEPVLANAFGSYVVTIPDDDVMQLTLPVDWGHVFISSSSTNLHGMFWFRGSLVTKYFGPNAVVAGTGALTGTTGTDGQVTLSCTGNIMYLENRSGGSQKISITLIGVNRAFD